MSGANDDPLDVTWVGSSGDADNINAATDETPKTEESCGGSSGGGESHGSSPRSSNSNSNSGSSNSSSSSSTSSSNSSLSSGSGAAVGCAAELPTGEGHRLQSCNNPVIVPYRT